jgi:uncharacterized protein (TIGR02231 family)
MRRDLFPAPLAIALLATVLSLPAFSGEYPSRVERVVLYPDMAEVTRVVEVPAPDAAVVLPGLTADLLADTLSARVLDGEARIAGLTVEDFFRPLPVDERVGELARRIEEMTDEKRRAEEAASAGRREKELLDRGILAIYAAGQGAKGPEAGRSPRLSSAEVEAALSLYRSRAEALDAAVFAAERAARDLDRRIAAARKELEKIRPPQPTREKAVRVALAPAAECRIAVSYLVASAGFLPRYNARLSPAARALSLELAAEAWQRTGEDWADAVFVFSTARPARTAQLPPLPPWEIDFRAAPVARPMMMIRAEVADEAVGASAAAAERDEAPPAPARRFASFEATLAGTHSLGGDGEKKTFLVARHAQETDVSWRAVPKTTEGAYVAAVGRNETGLPVFAAPASLFLEDAYVGRGNLPDIPEGEELRIDFGKDPSVTVVRKELSRRREEGGVFARVRRVRFRYEITAQNFRKEPAPLTVLDQVPVPRHKEIVVKDLEVAGGGTEGELGEVRWEFTLAPGEKRVLGLSFTVEHPADKEIHGL